METQCMFKSLRNSAFIAAAGLALCAGAASAQNGPPEKPTDAALSGVTVTAPRVVTRPLYGTAEKLMSLSVRVKFRDLDMSTPAGVAELDRRVAEATEYACRQLGVMYPDARPDQRMCERETQSGTEPQLVMARAVR
jgi:UrcA family protein